LQGVSLSRLQEVIADSNQQKYRYEIREGKDGTRIRASGKKGRKQRSKPDHTREHKDRESGRAGKGSAKGNRDTESRGGADKDNGKVTQKAAAKATATKAAPPAADVPKAAPSVAKDKTESGNESKVSTTSEAPIPKKASAKANEANTAGNARARQTAAAKQMSTFGVRPPGMVPPASQAQFMMQMQAMQQMLTSPNHIAVRQQVQRLMQMRMMKQWQAMQAYQMQAHMQAMQVQHMAALQEMHQYIEEWCNEHPEEDSGLYEDYDEDEEESAIGAVPETAEELEAKIQEVLAAAAVRNAELQKEQEKTTSPTKASSSSEQPLNNLEAKIAEALQAAANRNAEAKAASQPPPAPVRPSPAPQPQDIDVQAKIAQALKAAQARSNAKTASSSVVAAKAVSPPKPRPQISKAASPDPSVSLQEQIAKALEAAKERQSTK